MEHGQQQNGNKVLMTLCTRVDGCRDSLIDEWRNILMVFSFQDNICESSYVYCLGKIDFIFFFHYWCGFGVNDNFGLFFSFMEHINKAIDLYNSFAIKIQFLYFLVCHSIWNAFDKHVYYDINYKNLLKALNIYAF